MRIMRSYQEQARVGLQEAVVKISARNGRAMIGEAIARSPQAETSHYIGHPNRRIKTPQYALGFEEPEEGRSVFRIGSWTPYDGGVNFTVVFSEKLEDPPVQAVLEFGVGKAQDKKPQRMLEAPISGKDIGRILRIIRERGQKDVEELLRESYSLIRPNDEHFTRRGEFMRAMGLFGTDDHAKKVLIWKSPNN